MSAGVDRAKGKNFTVDAPVDELGVGWEDSGPWALKKDAAGSVLASTRVGFMDELQRARESIDRWAVGYPPIRASQAER